MSRLSWLAAAAALSLTAACVHDDSTSASSSAATRTASTTERTTTTTTTPSTASTPSTSTTTTQSTTTQSAQATTPPAATTPATPGVYTDAQLRSFVTASAEIDPLNRQLATATGEQRTAIVGQIRASLERNAIDSATYNAIAAQAQTDTALATRIASLRSPTTTPQGQ